MPVRPALPATVVITQARHPLEGRDLRVLGWMRRLGRTMIINPGSDYSTGALNGALITLDQDKIKAHQLVRG